MSVAAKSDFIPAPIRLIAPYWILALIVLAVYGNIYDNAFVFDDDLLITANSYLRGWSHIGDILTGSTISGIHIAGGFYRPVQIMLYLLLWHLGDGSVFPFHMLNISIHIANTCLVYRLGAKLKFAPWGVFLASLIWGLHTLHTEAVTYMSATADPLFAFFCLLSIVLLLPDISPRGILKIIPLFILGLFTKETMVMLPLLIMICLFYVSPDRLNWRLYLRTWPLWLMTVCFAYWRTHVTWLDGPQTYARLYHLHEFANLKMYADHPAFRIYTFMASLSAYLYLLVNPVGLHMERAFSIYTDPLTPPVLTGLALCLLAGAQIIRSSLKPPAGMPLSWGLLWFGAAHAPDSGLLVPMNSLFLEHWMYLPTVGLFLGIGETLARLLQNRPRILAIGASAAAIGFAGMLMVRTYIQNEIWNNPVSFYSNIFAYGERSARAHNNLALYYSNRGDTAHAVEQFKQALAISDTYAETRYNFALVYLAMPDHDAHMQDVIDNLNRSLEIDPKFYRAWYLLSKVYEMQGDRQKAEEAHARAVELMPSLQ